jgi:hypothetical protein
VLHIPPISLSLISWSEYYLVNRTNHYTVFSCYFLPLRPKYLPQLPNLKNRQPVLSFPLIQNQIPSSLHFSLNVFRQHKGKTKYIKREIANIFISLVLKFVFQIFYSYGEYLKKRDEKNFYPLISWGLVTLQQICDCNTRANGTRNVEIMNEFKKYVFLIAFFYNE